MTNTQKDDLRFEVSPLKQRWPLPSHEPPSLSDARPILATHPSGIAGKLHLSKSTLYSTLRHRGVDIGPYTKPAQARTDKAPEPSVKTATILLSLRIENNNSFVRGKKRVKDGLEPYLRHQYAATLQPSGQYRLKVPYRSDEELDRTMKDLLQHIGLEADLRNCFSESSASLKNSDRSW